MNFQEWVADLEAKAESALQALENFNQAHPEIAGVEADALKTGVSDLAGVAKNAVAADAPPAIAPTIDDVIAGIEAQAESDIAKITEAKNAKVAALQSVAAQ